MRRRIRLVRIHSIALLSMAALSSWAAAQQSPHAGSPQEALVGVEVANSAGDGAASQVRHGNGLLIRCDGYVLVPVGLVSRTVSVAGQSEEAGSQSIAVLMYPGSPLEKRFRAKRPRFIPKDQPFCVIKADDLHAPAARPLLTDSLEPGARLEVFTTAWDPAAKRFQPPARAVAEYEGASREESAPPGSRALRAPMENAVPGSVVSGPDGKAVGIVCQGGAARRFASFEYLHLATNCVSASSLPDSALNAAPKTGPMVAVEGGRVRLGPAAIAEQPDLEGSASACVAPFKIDQFEVTNEEYLNYWLTLPDEQKRKLGFRANYFPASWARSGLPFPPELTRFPVLGVPLPGAMGYARWAGKRLPTPYEWCMAAFGPQGEQQEPDWIRRYVAERQGAWQRIKQAHIGYLRQHPELQNDALFLGGLYQLPWIGRTPAQDEASAFSHDVIRRFQDPVMALFGDPLYLAPAGSRPLDVSPSGAMDMILNASETVLPNPGPPARGSARNMEVMWQIVPPDLREPWRPRKTEALTDGRPLPPLSRLVRRALLGPDAGEIVLWSHLNETSLMLWPIAGWRLTMSADTQSEAALWPRGMNPYTGLNRPSSFRFWESPPERFRRELGLPLPLDKPDAHMPPGVQLLYLLPNGFRCAR